MIIGQFIHLTDYSFIKIEGFVFTDYDFFQVCGVLDELDESGEQLGLPFPTVHEEGMEHGQFKPTQTCDFMIKFLL